MAMKRVCDICGVEAMDKCYEFAVPSVLVDNAGVEAVDSSYTDVCPTCVAKRQIDIVARLIAKAQG